MAFHIPFNQRANRRQNLGPIYIGFEPEQPPRPKFNWWGFHGMWLSFASLTTLGFASFIPLLISIVGLRRPGKKMATVGTVVSLGGLLLAGSVVASIAGHQHMRHHRRQMALQHRQVQQQISETESMIAEAREDLIEYRGAHEGYLPNDLEGNMLVVGYVDPWGESLRFEPAEDFSAIRSAGPDRKFLTRDDVFEPITGKVETAPRHLPVSTEAQAN